MESPKALQFDEIVESQDSAHQKEQKEAEIEVETEPVFF